MGHFDDFIYDIFEVLEKNNLKEEFYTQLSKMDNQDKHRYKSHRDRYRYAFDKVIRIYEEDKVKSNLTF